MLKTKLKTHTWIGNEIGKILYLFVVIVRNPWVVIVGNSTCVVGWTRNLGLVETCVTQTWKLRDLVLKICVRQTWKPM